LGGGDGGGEALAEDEILRVEYSRGNACLQHLSPGVEVFPFLGPIKRGAALEDQFGHVGMSGDDRERRRELEVNGGKSRVRYGDRGGRPEDRPPPNPSFPTRPSRMVSWRVVLPSEKSLSSTVSIRVAVGVKDWPIE